MVPFYGLDSTASRLQSYYEEAVYFLPLSSQKKFWYSIDLPGKDERLQSQSHPVVLNVVPLDRESSALTTRALLQHKLILSVILIRENFVNKFNYIYILQHQIVVHIVILFCLFELGYITPKATGFVTWGYIHQKKRKKCNKKS